MPTTLNLGESLALFSENITDIRKACVDNVVAFQKENTQSKELDVDSDWSRDDIHAHVNCLRVKNKTKNYIRTIKRIDSLKATTHPGVVKLDDLIPKAKEFPIVEMYDDRLFTAGTNKKKGICPFHTEKTPSFNINTETNKWYCFGCNKGGDSISYVMERDGCNFVEAVKKLSV